MRKKKDDLYTPFEAGGHIGDAEPVPIENFVATQELEDELYELTTKKDLTDADLEKFTRYAQLLRYEYKTRRWNLVRRLYRILDLALIQIELKMQSGQPIDMSANQLRLFTQMFLDQTRDEFGDKSPDTVINNQQQTVVQLIEVEKSRDNGRMVTVEHGS